MKRRLADIAFSSNSKMRRRTTQKTPEHTWHRNRHHSLFPIVQERKRNFNIRLLCTKDFDYEAWLEPATILKGVKFGVVTHQRQSNEIWHSLAWKKFSDISEEPFTFVFGVLETVDPNLQYLKLLHRVRLLFNLKDELTEISFNVVGTACFSQDQLKSMFVNILKWAVHGPRVSLTH